MKKEDSKKKVLRIITVVTESLPQMKISENESSFSSFPHCHNHSNDCSFP